MWTAFPFTKSLGSTLSTTEARKLTLKERIIVQPTEAKIVTAKQIAESAQRVAAIALP